MKKYNVLETFIEKEHENTEYKKGKTYPAEGFEADPKRVEFLQATHEEYGVAFLGEEIRQVEEIKEPDQKPEEEVKTVEKEEVKPVVKPKPAPKKPADEK